MSDNHVPLRVIQEVSGHRNLEQLQAYIEVRDEQVLGAVTGLSMLSPIPQSEKYVYPGLEKERTQKEQVDPSGGG
jgi:integrase/recombinase XerD